MREKQTSFPIRCDECGAIVGERRNGFLILKSKHHSRRHVTILRIADLVDKGDEPAEEPQSQQRP